MRTAYMYTVRVRNPQNNSAIPALLLSLAEIALFAPPFWEEEPVVLSYFFAMTMDSISFKIVIHFVLP